MRRFFGRLGIAVLAVAQLSAMGMETLNIRLRIGDGYINQWENLPIDRQDRSGEIVIDGRFIYYDNDSPWIQIWVQNFSPSMRKWSIASSNLPPYEHGGDRSIVVYLPDLIQVTLTNTGYWLSAQHTVQLELSLQQRVLHWETSLIFVAAV
ncbi:MAG: hypothetical protein LBF65_02830 [Holosporales bacterium]|jgi:hypothetical protein|nr:hypothetical protein [Holosporales bacterium]